MKRLVLALALALAACSGSGAPLAHPTPAPPAEISFIDDDYARALARARSEKKPLFVDAWAPWCHSCLSTRAFVFTDPSLRPLADRFVWLAIDTEKASNAPFVEKFPVEEWPTLFVIDPSNETPVLKWGGSGTAAELAILLEDSEGAIAHGAATQGEASAAFLRGNALVAAGKQADALKEYRASLAAAPADWPRRARVVEALTNVLSATGDHATCVKVAMAELPELPAGTARARVALNGAECARALGKSAVDPLKVFVEILARIAVDPGTQLLADDRSDVFGEVVDVKTELGDTAAAERFAEKWVAFLDAQAKAAPDAAARAVFDAHRLFAYLAVHQPEKAVPMLLESERDFPDDYNPPARLAKAYLEMGKLDEALAAIDRALGKAYGPRKMRLYSLKADVLLAKKDKAGAKSTLKEAVALGESLSLTGGYAKLVGELKARAAKL